MYEVYGSKNVPLSNTYVNLYSMPLCDRRLTLPILVHFVSLLLLLTTCLFNSAKAVALTRFNEATNLAFGPRGDRLT